MEHANAQISAAEIRGSIFKSLHLSMGCWTDVGNHVTGCRTDNAVVLDDNSSVSLITGCRRLALHLECLHHEALCRFFVDHDQPFSIGWRPSQESRSWADHNQIHELDTA